MNKTKDVLAYFVYDQFGYATQYIRTQKEKMCEHLGISISRFNSYVSNGHRFKNRQVYKLTTDEKMERLI